MNVSYLDDFIGVYDDVVSQEDCDKLINHFYRVQDEQLSLGRQQAEPDSNKSDKDDEVYFISQTSKSYNDDRVSSYTSKGDSYVFNVFKEALNQAYSHYTNKYSILQAMRYHHLSGAIKIQKTQPGQGYHVWHCEHMSGNFGERIAAVILYLNDVEEGGETEFLYQHKRVAPKAGRLLICPAYYTHTHRGNPPLTGDKYIVTSWIEFGNPEG